MSLHEREKICFALNILKNLTNRKGYLCSTITTEVLIRMHTKCKDWIELYNLMESTIGFTEGVNSKVSGTLRQNTGQK